MQRHFVKNVEEAVELALRFKAEGRYDWFRGQLDAKWTPSSSKERTKDSPELLAQRLMRFCSWASKVPSLRYLTDPVNCHQLFAVLQHWGFPTNYIDFSTEPGVAAFFASDCSKPPAPETVSIIYCLDTADLRDFYDKHITPHSNKTPEPLRIDLVSVDVDNLWRLQAQAGHFVFTNHKWYEVYDLDSIEFPWTGYPSFPTKSRIYPEHRSALEQLIEEYFKDENYALASQNFLREQSEQEATGQPKFKLIWGSSTGYDADAFVTPPPELPSWGEEALKCWLEVPAELFHDAVGHREVVTLRQGANVPLPSVQLTYGIATAMRLDISLRQRAVQWELEGLPGVVSRASLEKLVREAWNGMRRLPYTDEDIAVACGSLLALCAQPGCLSLDGGKVRQAFQVWCPDAMEVAFGAKGDSGARGYCSAAQLNKVISPIWLSMQPLDGLAKTPESALQLCQVPQRIMEFPAFAQIFGRQLIPSQLVRRGSLVHFNPARLDAFSLP